MRIVIIGATGLLGQELTRHFRSQPLSVELVPLSHHDIEITDPQQVRTILEANAPDAIINCAALLDVDACESNQSYCFQVNQEGVRNILDATQNLPRPALFIHTSSSEVFGRIREGEYQINGYTEDYHPRPVSAYQRSKKGGEDILQEFARRFPDRLKRWYVVRLGWLYGAGRPTYVEYFTDRILRGESFKVVSDQWRSPTWTAQAADRLQTLIRTDAYPSGIYHLANEVRNGEATPLDVVEEIRGWLDSRAKSALIEPVPRANFFKVPRAPSNVLRNTKLPPLPYWRLALREYLETKSF